MVEKVMEGYFIAFLGNQLYEEREFHQGVHRDGVGGGDTNLLRSGCEGSGR